MVKVKVVSDDDGHWYVIPEVLEGKFNFLLDTGENDEFVEFNDFFSQYRTGGDINNVDLYAEID